MPMHWLSRIVLASFVVGVLPGCSDSRYKVIDVPFCVTEEPGVNATLAKHYVLLHRAGDSQGVGSFSQQWSGPDTVGWFSGPDVRLALLECSEQVRNVELEWAKQLDENHVPTVCGGQRVVFNQTLEVVRNERSKGLGYGGFLRFPKVDLACATGTMVQANDYTLRQIIDDFIESADRYYTAHEALPGSFEELARTTKAPPLPPDPWGTAWKFETHSSEGKVVQIRLISAGPDATFGSEDDVEVLDKRGSSSSSINQFPDLSVSGSADSQAMLRSRGIE